MSDVLTFFREQDPQLKSVPDDELTAFIGDTEPDFLAAPEFRSSYDRAKKRVPLRRELEQERRMSVFPERQSALFGTAADLLRPMAATPENPFGTIGTVAKEAGRAANVVGDAAGKGAAAFLAGAGPADALHDVLSGPSVTVATPPRSGFSGAVQEGIVDAARTAPVVALGAALSELGIPPAVAFAGAMGGSTFAATDDPVAAAKSAMTGALVPGVGNIAREAAAKSLAGLVEAGVIKPGARFAQKAVETLAAQGGIQAFLEGLNIPEYLAMTPEQRKETLVRNLAANSAFMAMDLPGLASAKVPSATEGRTAKAEPAIRVSHLMDDLVQSPEALDTLRKAADNEALRRMGMQTEQTAPVTIAPIVTVDPASMLASVRRDEIQPGAAPQIETPPARFVDPEAPVNNPEDMPVPAEAQVAVEAPTAPVARDDIEAGRPAEVQNPPPAFVAPPEVPVEAPAVEEAKIRVSPPQPSEPTPAPEPPPKPTEPSPAAESGSERGYYREPSGKTVIVMPKAEYDALEPGVRDKIRRYFNWSPTRKAFISKASKEDQFWTRDIARRANLQEMAARPAPVKQPKGGENNGKSKETKEGVLNPQESGPGAVSAPSSAPDLAKDRESIAATTAQLKALASDENDLLLAKRKLEQAVLVQTGPKWRRGQIKASAKGTDLAAYEQVKRRLTDIDTAQRVLKAQMEPAAKRVKAADLEAIAADEQSPAWRRTGAKVGAMVLRGEDVPNELLQASEGSAGEELRRMFPDITEAEARKLVSYVQTEAMRGTSQAEMERSFQLDPVRNLQRRRRIDLAELVRKETSGGGFGELPDPIKAELEKRIPSWTYGQEPGKGSTQISAADLTELPAKVKEAVAEGRRLRIENEKAATAAAEAERAADEAEEAKARQMMADAAAEMEATGKARPAKEIKAELISRLEDAIKKASPDGPKRVLIAVPGDGIFALRNDRVKLQEVLKRAKTLAVHGETDIGDVKPQSVRVPKLGAALNPGKDLEDFVSTDADRKGLHKPHVEADRALATNGRMIVEIKGKFAPAPAEGFPKEAVDQVVKDYTARSKPAVSIATEDLFRAGRLVARMDYGPSDPWVDLFVSKDGKFYAETKDAEGDTGSFGTPTTDNYLGRYNGTDLESIARLARKAGDETVSFARSDVPLKEGESAMKGSVVSGKTWRALASRFKTEAEAPPAAATKTEINKGALGTAGMGGAKPTEFSAGAGTATGIKNATVDAERAMRGLPPAMQPARRAFGDVWDEAMAIVDANPAFQDALISKLGTEPRAVTDLEDALLLHRQIDLQNEYGKQSRELAAAYDDAKRFPDRLEAVERHKAMLQEVSNQLRELYDINKAVGTATSRGLNARKMMALEDFSLAQMEMDMREAMDGAPLDDTQRQRLDAAHGRIAELEAKLAQRTAEADAERANQASAETMARMQKEAAAGFSPQVLAMAERLVSKMEQAADAARARLAGKLARTSAGVDPTILYDVSIIGAAKIARGAVDFARWSEKMIEDLGEAVRPMLAEAWPMAQAKHDSEISKAAGPAAGEVRRALRKDDIIGQRAAIRDGVQAALAEGQPLRELGPFIRKLALNFVRGGIRERQELIDAVHNELAALIPDLTPRQTMDAISGYGDFKPLDPEAAKATLRDLRGQMQQVAKLEDIEARRPPLKSGVERRTPSDEERRLIARVNEAKRRFGVVSADPSRQLKSALDTIKTRLKNQIADLNYQIATGTKIVRTKSTVGDDAEAAALRTQREILKRQFDEIFPRPGLTDAQRAAMAERAIERSIADYETRLAAGNAAPLRGEAREVRSARLDALRARRDALRAEMDALRRAAKANVSDADLLVALKARMANRIATYQERLAAGDFEVPKRRQVPLDNEALRMQAQLDMAKAEWHKGLEKLRWANRSLPHRVFGGVREALNLPRAIMSSMDVSAVLRQGGFIALAHPVRAARALAPMFRAWSSSERAAMENASIMARENAPLYHRSKLYLAPLDTVRLSSMEEAFMSRLAERIPGVGASNRAYVTFLNRLRADSFDALYSRLQRNGPELNQPELEAIGNFVNAATGRGNLGRASAAAETLATAFFSPRLVASRFQLVLGQPAWRGTARTRLMVAGEYARFLGGLAVMYGLARLAGADVESDPRSSDFGKLKFGNTRVDPLAGLSQTTVLLSRILSGQKKSIDGKVESIRGNVPFGHGDTADIVLRFLRSKLAPVPGAVLDVASGRDVVGEPVTPLGAAGRALVPLSFQDIYEVMKADGVGKATALGILSLFGWGLQQFDDPANRDQVNALMRNVRGGTPEDRQALRAQLLEQLKR